MGIALGVTVFATAAGAVGALAGLGPLGPIVAVGVLVSSSTRYNKSFLMTRTKDRRSNRCHFRTGRTHCIHRENKRYAKKNTHGFRLYQA